MVGRGRYLGFMGRRLFPSAAAVLFVGVAVGGCGVERTLRLESEPPGALVYLNGREVARTPAEVPLDWYGKYDVAVRKEGYETLKTERWVVAPWWQWPPFDLVAELVPLPLHDRHRLEFELRAAQPGDEGVLERAEAMKSTE